MVFDLSSFAGQSIRTATLTITQPGFYTSSDASETVTLWNFTGDVNALASYSYPSIQPTGAVAAAMCDDLRSGTSYGSVDIAQFDLQPVPLPAAAWLFGSGLMGLGTVMRRRKQTAA